MHYNNLIMEQELPKPLTRNELYECLKLMKMGNDKARQVVIIHNIRFVLYQVSKFSNVPYDKDELVSVGLIGLIKSVDTFNIDRNFEFATYASRCIINEILLFIRKSKKYINDESLHTSVLKDYNGIEIKLEDTLEDIKVNFVSDYEKKETCYEIRNLLDTLSGRDKEIIMLRFGFFDRVYNQREISEMLNISQSLVSRLIIKALKKLRFEIEYRNSCVKTLKI